MNDLWDDPGSQSLKLELTRKLFFAEMGKEPLWMPRSLRVLRTLAEQRDFVQTRRTPCPQGVLRVK